MPVGGIKNNFILLLQYKRNLIMYLLYSYYIIIPALFLCFHFHIIHTWVHISVPSRITQKICLINIRWYEDSKETNRAESHSITFSNLFILNRNLYQYPGDYPGNTRLGRTNRFWQKLDVSNSYLHKVSMASVFQVCWISQVWKGTLFFFS